MLDVKKMQEYASPVQADLETFDRRLADYLKGDSPLISSIARHLLKSRGKRIRPAFVFLSSRASDNFTDYSIDASLAIELIHTATLLHDDVVDAADVRRGKKTVNAQWTNLIAVLMGDYLFAKAFRIMVAANSMDLIAAISRATERVSVGELRQIEETANYALSEEEYLEIISDKTASLFNVSCETGPILNNRHRSERERFATFGERIGTAFQIADDLLDFIGDPDVTGKERGNDVLTGKVTLPLIHSLKQVNEKSGREIVKHLSNGNKEESDEVFEKIYTFVHENGGLDYAYRRADELCNQGLESLPAYDDSIYYQSLTSMVHYTVARSS
ncbi:polyprenyl synthetase family protein [candidate division GN15 bacterium]|nr:polyprenyl synthetase family protein [candidate division GN15 bacterium]